MYSSLRRPRKYGVSLVAIKLIIHPLFFCNSTFIFLFDGSDSSVRCVCTARSVWTDVQMEGFVLLTHIKLSDGICARDGDDAKRTFFNMLEHLVTQTHTFFCTAHEPNAGEGISGAQPISSNYIGVYSLPQQ